MKRKIAIIIAVLVLLTIAYWGYSKYSYSSKIETITACLHANDFDMAIQKTKDLIYDNEDDNVAKALMLYARTREYFYEKKITSAKSAIRVSLNNLLTIKKLIFQSELFEKGLLDIKERQEFLQNKQDLLLQLRKNSISYMNLEDIEASLQYLCEMGITELNLAYGDEIDQVLHAFLLAGSAYFGNEQSADKLIDLIYSNSSYDEILHLAGIEIAPILKKKSETLKLPLTPTAKYIISKHAIKEILPTLFEKFNKMQCATSRLADREDFQKLRYMSHKISYKNNDLFYEKGLFDKFLEFRTQNPKFGLNASIFLVKDNLLNKNSSFIGLYFFDPVAKKYVSKFYTLTGNSVKELKIDYDETYMDVANSPVIIVDFNQDESYLELVSYQVKRETRYKSEYVYNSQKHYNSYYGYSGGYEYVNVPYTVDVMTPVNLKYFVFEDNVSLYNDDSTDRDF